MTDEELKMALDGLSRDYRYLETMLDQAHKEEEIQAKKNEEDTTK